MFYLKKKTTFSTQTKEASRTNTVHTYHQESQEISKLALCFWRSERETKASISLCYKKGVEGEVIFNGSGKLKCKDSSGCEDEELSISNSNGLADVTCQVLFIEDIFQLFYSNHQQRNKEH